MRHLLATTLALLALSLPTLGAPLIFGPTTINSTNLVFSAEQGVAITQSYSMTDTIDFLVMGTINIATGENGQGFEINAAGVTVNQSSSIFNTPNLPRGTVAINPPYGNFGSLLVRLNSGSYIPLFDAALNGSGNTSSVPTTLGRSTTVGALFGSALTAGDTLFFSISDNNSSDNTGAFTLSAVNPAASVPELDATSAALPLALVLLLGLALSDRRSQVNA